MNVRTTRVSCVLVVVLALGLGTACSSKAPRDVAEESSAVKGDDGKSSYGDRKCAEVEASVDLVEDGVSVVYEESPKKLQVSYAVVIENSDAGKYLRSAVADVSLVDSAGNAVDDGEKSPTAAYEASWEVLSLGPGQKTAITGRGFVTEEPEAVSVKFSETCMVDATSKEVPQVSVDDVELSKDAETVTCSATVSSDFRRAFQAIPFLVFRNKSGEIVGGGPWTAAPPSESWEWMTVKLGSSDQTVVLEAAGYLPDGVDLDKSELFVQQAPEQWLYGE